MPEGGSVTYNLAQELHRPALAFFKQKARVIQRSTMMCRWKRFVVHARAQRHRQQLGGDVLMEQLRRALDSFSVTRKPHQVRFHDKFMASRLPKIYTKEWASEFDSIMAKNGVEILKQETLVVCPRRFGKTYAVAMFCAAFIWCIPDCEVAIFSTGQRTARKLMQLCIFFLAQFDGFIEVLRTKNAEEILLEFSRTDKRKLNCYPGTVKVFLFLSLSLYLSLSIPQKGEQP